MTENGAQAAVDPQGMARGLRRLALDGGFAVFGIATPSELQGVPEHADPANLLEGYRAVIILGAPPPGYVSLGPKSPVMLESEPSETLSRIRERLVRAEFRVTPAGGAALSLPRVAVAAGIGALAPNGMVVVNRWGLSLQLFALITDAPLPATPLPGQSRDQAICRACRVCLEDCPAAPEGSEGDFDRSWCTGCDTCLTACPLDASTQRGR
ncbi:MAG: hypothetical protein Kow00129_04390 [Thermoleophilia bacterium]